MKKQPQKEELEEQLRMRLSQRVGARGSLMEFIKFCKSDYIAKRFHEIIIENVEWWVRTPGAKMILCMPPQLGKSEIVSRYLPAYIFGVDPDAAVIATSYDFGRAADNSRDVMRIIDDPLYGELFPSTKLQTKGIKTKKSYKRTEELWEIVDQRGKYKCSGIGGGITGFGFKYGVIDDPVKGAEEANSFKLREKTWDWYLQEFLTRRTVDARVMVMATRWNKEDLIGKILQMPDASEWRVISFPLIALDPGQQGPYEYRKPGEILWPEEYSEAELRDIQQDSYTFSALYQQDPVIREGGIIERSWINIVHGIPDLSQVALYWDIATSSSDISDSTVGTVMARSVDKRGIVLHQDGFRLNPNERNKRILATCKRFLSMFPRLKIFVEAGIMMGKQSTDELRNYLLENAIPVKMDNTRVSKYERSISQVDAVRSAIEAQRIDFYDGFLENNWIHDFFEEVLQMRFVQKSTGPDWDAPHDDRWDSLAGAWNKTSKLEAGIQFIEDIIRQNQAEKSPEQIFTEQLFSNDPTIWQM